MAEPSRRMEEGAAAPNRVHLPNRDHHPNRRGATDLATTARRA
jgi:hypothetical protein